MMEFLPSAEEIKAKRLSDEVDLHTARRELLRKNILSRLNTPKRLSDKEVRYLLILLCNEVLR